MDLPTRAKSERNARRAASSWRGQLAPAVAWVGVLLTLVLVFRRENAFCGNAAGCEVVTHSAYAKVAGVSLT